MNNIKIYTKDNCIYCLLAKELLASKQLSYEEIKMNIDIPREEIIEQFKNSFENERVTMPIIIIDEKFVGGYNNLQQVLGGS